MSVIPTHTLTVDWRTALRDRVQLYRELSKSGIVALVVISVLGGYLVGQRPGHEFSAARLVATLFGVLFLAAGSSALNQLQDREIDARMPRTARRPLPSGRISVGEAWAFVGATLFLGLNVLAALDGQLLVLGVAAVLSYNGLYTLWWERQWAHAAIPGAIPGALPILMGHAAASGDALDAGGIYLFFILIFWQMPHFWVLALRFREDYERGGIPTLPVALGDQVTTQQIRIWCLGYLGLFFLAPLFLPVGAAYLGIALATSFMVLKEMRAFLKQPESKGWLRFFLWVNFSLILIVFGAVADLWLDPLLGPWWVR